MSEELAREIEAGRGTDEAVALALGWKELNPTPLVKPWERPWMTTKGGAAGSHCPGPPAFRSDLNALAAECERRNRGWSVDMTDEGVSAWVDTHDGWDAAEGRVSAEPGVPLGGIHAARALCAALVRAAGETR